ncbi:MAG: sigma-70 family RNA polymerase sigma factor [Chloroflexi bacterium]|nr:sigma-70 family RNA polymerase sigma factor [Chloroflexota bacterium]MBI3734234.1 sigma-70 family RNA polymerase sigma factor [Chloroflexota bacterium]
MSAMTVNPPSTAAVHAETLLQRARRQDAGAWAEIYDQYYPRIYAFLLTRVRDRALAEDLAADVFVNALRAIASYEDRGFELAAWLFRIAHNRLTDHLRRTMVRGSDSLDELEEEQDISLLAGQDAEPAHGEAMDLRRALEQLNPTQRQVIHLRFMEGLTSEQVARIMGKSAGAIKILQYRALKTLKRLLTEKPQSL